MRLSGATRRTQRCLAALALCATAAMTVLAPSSAYAASRGGDRGEPGSLTGYAFDACAAPAQEVMDAWRLSSPYSGVGIYVGGSNRLCEQPELDADWVRTQQRQGWHLLPVWVGPQAACSGYVDVMSPDLPTAEQQGRAQAATAVSTARGLGIGRGSTLYYDLEDYDTGPDDCRQAALSLLSGWTKGLHRAGYRSGVYSSIGAAITSLDYAHRVSRGSYAMPDDIWFAWANGRSDVRTDSRVLSSEWDDHARIHQYAVDVSQTFGGYTLGIDANWVDVGRGSVAPRSRALCRGVDADLRRYPTLRTGRSGDAVRVAQCLLRRQHVTKAPITGRYDARTAAAVRKAQRRLDLPENGRLTRSTWTALLAHGGRPLLKVGDTGPAVLRLQRALTAALGRPVRIDGVVDKRTARAVAAYQRSHGLPATGVVTTGVWDSLS